MSPWCPFTLNRACGTSMTCSGRGPYANWSVLTRPSWAEISTPHTLHGDAPQIRGEAMLSFRHWQLSSSSSSVFPIPTGLLASHITRDNQTPPRTSGRPRPLFGRVFALTNSVGSDHLLRTVTLLSLTTQHDKVTIKFTKWDQYRTAFINFDEAPDSSLQIGLGQRFMHNIKSALFEATTTVQVEPVSPPPNLYLLNSWASRLPVLQSYRRSNSAPPHPAQPSHRHCETSHAVFQSRQLACTLLIQREDWPRQDMTYISW